MLVISCFVGCCLFFPTVNTENPTVKESFHRQHLSPSRVRCKDVTKKDGSGGPEPQSKALNARTFLFLEKKNNSSIVLLLYISSSLKFWKRCRRWKNVKKRKQEFKRPENITEFQNLGSKKTISFHIWLNEIITCTESSFVPRAITKVETRGDTWPYIVQTQ